VDPLHSAVVAGERSGRDAPFTIASLFMRMRAAKLHRPERPRRGRGAINGRLRKQLELANASRPLSQTCSSAIGSSVATAEDDDMLIARLAASSGKRITGDSSVLRRQKIHCEMDPAQLATRNTQIAGDTRSGSNTNCIELRSQIGHRHVFADVDARTELHSLRLKLSKAEIEHRFLEFEIRNSITKQSASPFVLLEDDDGVSEAAKLLRSSKPGGSRPYYRDAEP
jgi:hypothetical protein